MRRFVLVLALTTIACGRGVTNPRNIFSINGTWNTGSYRDTIFG